MINWAKSHPVWASLIGVFIAFIAYMLFFRSSTPEVQGAINTVQQDPSLVAGGQQLQAMQIQGQFATQQTQIAADVEADRQATQLAIAKLTAQLSTVNIDAQKQIAAQQIASQEKIVTLQSTLQKQVEQARIASETQNAQLQATTAIQIQQTQAAMMKAIQASNADVQKSLAQSNAQIQTQLIQSNEKVSTAQIKASSKKSLCFITTAYVTLQGKPDDCAELQLARKWRDEWLLKQADGAVLVATYYECAPRFLERIKTWESRDTIIGDIGEAFIEPVLQAIRDGQNLRAFYLYVEMLDYIGYNYDSPTLDAILAWRHGGASGLALAA